MGLFAVSMAVTLLVPADHEGIQAAIDASEPGGTVIVAGGTYRGPVRLKPGVVLRSSGDDARGKLGLSRAEATIIVGPVEMAEGATIDGFTVTGVGRYDDKVWQHHYETRGSEQPHEPIGAPGVPGIAASGACSVLNNIVHHIGYTGIGVTGGTARVAGNTCFRNMGGGIGAMRGAKALIESNVCYENFYAGIGCEAASPVIRGNDCYDNVRAGIGVSEGSSPLVTGNRCHDNRRAGIGVRTGNDTRPVLVENECRANGMAGIGVEEGAFPEIRGNRIVANRLVGIGVTGGSRAVIVGNEVEREGGMPPIIVVLAGCQAVVSGNTVRGGGVAGLLVAGKAEVTDNRFVRIGKPGGKGVWAHASAELSHAGNKFEGWAQGVSPMKGAKVTDASTGAKEAASPGPRGDASTGTK